MDRDDAAAALRDAERRTDAVRAGSRWPIRVLTIWGVVTLAVEPALAFSADRPWAMVLPLGVMIVFIAWVSGYVAKQRISASGFTRRYLAAVLPWGVLHAGYTLLVTVAEWRSVPFVLVGSAVVAAPLFVGAYAEGRSR
jgi:hypothetical protein